MSVDPLDMANNCAAAVERIARWQDEAPVEAYVARAGKTGMDSAELAGAMALVSIARDVRRVVDHLMRLEGDEAP